MPHHTLVTTYEVGAYTAAFLPSPSELLPEGPVSARRHGDAEPRRTRLGARHPKPTLQPPGHVSSVHDISTSPRLPALNPFCNPVDYLSVISTPQSFVYFQRFTLPFLRSLVLGGNIPCILRGHRITESIATRIDMGHIIMSEAPDQGPLLNRVSMAQYYVAVVFVLLRLVLYF